MIPIQIIRGNEKAPIFKRFRSEVGEHLLIVPHSRVFDLANGRPASFAPKPSDSDFPTSQQLQSLAETLANTLEGEVPLDQVVLPSPQSISLNISSSCNLSCSYCYAARGSFEGAQPNPMKWEVARAAIDKLLSEADPNSPVTIGFMGGEPFVSRRLVHEAVEYAAAEGKKRGFVVGFSVTTNGTLLCAEDFELFRRYPFAVTVSVDGGAKIQNLQRPSLRKSKSSYSLVREATRSLLALSGSTIIAARATVMRFDLNLEERFEAILSMGFPEVGFAPLRGATDNSGALRDADWPKYLESLTKVAESELERASKGHSIRLTNLAVSLKQLYRGACSPYPCGAGGGYFSVAANGDWYACHRAIGSSEYRLGDSEGIEVERQSAFLAARHVHAQAACRTCWARYLCSGGCHQEASNRNESACGFIRGWLEFCLAAYCVLIERRPEYFTSPKIDGKEEYGARSN
jgi:uncharacterized protein